MMFEVLEPNWHVLQQKLRSASTLDSLLAHHTEFLDASLRECMLRDAVLLKLLAKLLTICVIFADQVHSPRATWRCLLLTYCHVLPCLAMSCHVLPYLAMSCHVLPPSPTASLLTHRLTFAV